MRAPHLIQLGPPPGWRLDADFADLVRPAISRAAARAREIALGPDSAVSRGERPPGRAD